MLPRWLLHGPASITLHSITIRHCGNFRALPEERLKNLKSLHILEIEDCTQLSALPEGIESLTALRELKIQDCPILLKRCKQGIGEDLNKIAHILSISFGW
ncbi:putative disease resistance protein RGA3 [Vitis vinifera]|uniref:Putative disease resistance protein RGA3 n=1 Tax=Vitis vinifera TaxID=29760 RepID=A0A438DXR5_VITVI|nr:putative disease resistance protein RGA3 [Vitis vinifera]